MKTIINNYGVGVDLGGTTITIVITDSHCTVIDREYIATGNHIEPASTLLLISSNVKMMLSRNRIHPNSIKRAGIGVPGEVSPDSHRMRSSPILPTWRDVDIAKIMHQKTGIHFVIENDANATLIAEHALGPARNAQTVLLLTIGTGIGGAISINRQMISGSQGSAGEIGHIAVDNNGLHCWCGNHDCLGLYGSTSAMLDYYCEISGEHSHEINGEVFTHRYINNDPAAIKAFQRTTSYLAAGITQAVCVFAPESVILFGGIMDKLGRYYLHEINTKLKHRSYPAALSRVDVKTAMLGNDAGAIGASMLESDNKITDLLVKQGSRLVASV